MGKSNVYKIIHTQWYGNITPKDAEESKYVSVNRIQYFKATFTEETTPDGQPWTFHLSNDLRYVDAPDEFVNAMISLCMVDKLVVVKRNDEYNNATDIPWIDLCEQLPKVMEITYTVGVRGIAGGSGWADPENGLITTKSAVVGYRDSLSEQWFTKTFGYGGDLWVLGKIYDYITQARELGRTPEFTETQRKDIIGFEFMQHVFKLNDPPSKDRIVGECISGTWTDFDEGNNTLIADRGDSYETHFNYHLGNHAYAIGNTVYLNGVKWFDNFMDFICSLGVPPCVVEPLTDRCLSQGFYRCETILHILASLEPSYLCEFIGRNGDCSCSVNPKLYKDGVTIKFPVISRDGSHVTYEITWPGNGEEAADLSPVGKLIDMVSKAGFLEEVEYINYFGVWVKHTNGCKPDAVDFDKSRELDAVFK